MDEALPSLGDDALGEMAAIGAAPEETPAEEVVPTEEVTPEVGAETPADEETPPGDEDEGKGRTDKALQQRQQNLANREKALVAAEERFAEATASLKDLQAQLKANPTPANAAAVTEARKQAIGAKARADIAALKADPKFDRYTDGDKIDEILLTSMEQIEAQNTELKTAMDATNATTAEARRHEEWWNKFAEKNSDIGRAKGEELWSQSDKQADAEMKKLAEEGFPVTRVEAGRSVFRRLLEAERAKANAGGKDAGKRPASPASGGRLGPTAGRAGSIPSKPRTLEDRVAAGEFGLSDTIT
jgi:hypothetical protein